MASSSLSPRQLSSLQAIVNALLPPLEALEKEPTAEIQNYWSFDLQNDSDFVDALTLAIDVKLDAQERLQLQLLLVTMSTTLGSMGIFQMFATTPFTTWNTAEQTRALQKLQHSPFTLKRQAFNSLKRLICGLAYSYVQLDTKSNPFWKAMQYPGPPKEEEPMAKPDFDTERALVTIEKETSLEFDVVIVGSGAGGGVAAAILAKSGHSVLVLEKGSYIPPSEVTNLECEALDEMYEKHSLLTTSDGNVMILAGATLGGGTAINWACCLPLPEHVRNEWIQDHGLDQFGGEQYQESLHAVQERIGCVSTDTITHNTMNRKMKQGCSVMGYGCEATGQNLKDTSADSAGYTCFGDAQRNKQSGLVTFLADAVEHGARIVEHAAVERILYTNENGRRRATGVVATVSNGQEQQQHQLEVKARKCVIVAAGSLHSPCLLRRSGFSNPHIGRHLHLHPVTAASGFYTDGEEIHSYLGAPMTTVCSDFTNVKLECPCAHTGLLAAGLPFLNCRDFKDKMLRLRQAVPLIVLQRDVVSEGRVRVGADGFSPSIDYTLEKADKQCMMDGLKGAVQILVASGATEVGTGHNDDPGLHLLDGETLETAQDIQKSDNVQDYLASIDERGIQKHKMGVFSAHQMSTCRMSASPDSGVVDENGETWECDDLLVMDASVFPTASGANPMLTTLAISHMLSTRLAMRLQLEDDEAKHERASDGMPEWMKERKRKRASQPHYGYNVVSLLRWAAAAVAVVSVSLSKYWRD